MNDPHPIPLTSDDYRIAVELGPRTAWTAAPDGQLDFVSHHWMQWTGTSGLGASWTDGLHPEDRDRTVDVWLKSVETGEPYDIEHRARMRDGSFRWLRSRAQRVFDEAGRTVRWYGETTDIHDHRAADRQLRESNARFRAAMEAIGTLWTNDAEGRMTGEQPGWTGLTGQSRAEYEGYGWSDAVHPDDAAATLTAWDEAVRTRQPFVHEHRVRTGDGAWRTFAIRAVPVLDEQGGVLEWVGVHTDVTTQRDAERRLNEFNLRLEARVAERTRERDRAWTLSQDLQLVVGADGIIREANDAWTRILGWTLDQVIGQSHAFFSVDADRARSEDALDEALDRPLMPYVHRARHADGSFRWISWVTSSEGELIYAVGRDITAERNAADALRTAESRIRSIFETSFQLQGYLSPDGKLLAANASSLAVIEATPDRVLGMNFWEAPWFSETPGMSDQVKIAVEAAAAGQATRTQVTANMPGGPRDFDFSIRPVLDNAGHVIGLVPEAIDITRQRRTEAALRQAQKMEAVGQLTGGLAHDFNNLLAGISGSLELLKMRVAQGRTGELDRYLDAAQGASKRAAALTHRLLAFSRRQTLDPKPADLNHLVRGMEELVSRTVGPAIAVEVVTAEGLWNTLVDSSQLENALLNLCINARDAMPDGGKLTIVTANRWLDLKASREHEVPPGQYVSLSVSDTGTGMTSDTVARAFDPFFTTKPIGMGTGLGLSMIYGFARQSGGQVRIDSELGHGTTVCIHLPRHMGTAVSSEAVPRLSEDLKAQRDETVLVVDDEPTVRMLVVEVLGDLGYAAIEASEGHTALKVLRSPARIDLLVTDVGLPGGMNGRQIADAARQIRPGLKTLFITGYAETAVLSDGHLEPGMHVLTKPFSMEGLARRIKELIAG